jgi:anti-sigma regulatory factor (Ser/Thr protein kinase)
VKSPATHVGVTAPDRHERDTELQLPSALGSAGRARTFVSETLSGWGLSSSTVDDAVLLTSELVGNAVRHCQGETSVKVSWRGDRIRVQVRDNEARAPVLHSELSYDAENGRGLQLVDVLALSWGWRPVGPGKEVWFELPRT